MEVDAEVVPQHTLYVNNLPESVKTDDLTRAMHSIFGQFGNILDVVARRTYKLRGQAWVVFENIEDAKKAMELMQGFPLLDKQIRISYAKTKSDAAARQDGTYNLEEIEARREKRRQANQAKAAAKLPLHPVAPIRQAAPVAAPSNAVLLAENLPDSANEAMLSLVFQQFPGFKVVRMVDRKAGTAHVEYDDETGAAAALAGLQGFRLATDKPLQLSLANQQQQRVDLQLQ